MNKGLLTAYTQVPSNRNSTIVFWTYFQLLLEVFCAHCIFQRSLARVLSPFSIFIVTLMTSELNNESILLRFFVLESLKARMFFDYEFLSMV